MVFELFSFGFCFLLVLFLLLLLACGRACLCSFELLSFPSQPTGQRTKDKEGHEPFFQLDNQSNACDVVLQKPKFFLPP